MGKSKPKIPVDDYYLSVHYGLALRVDEIVAIRVDNKPLTPYLSTTENGRVEIALGGFFGGDQKRGGIFGTVSTFMGAPDQVLPAVLASKLKYNGETLTPETAPGYRGFTSVWFSGTILSDTVALVGRAAGFKWGSNSPQVPPTEFRVRRASVGLDPALATWTAPDGYKHVNPAHMIYEIMVDVDFGSGVPASQIEIETFQAAAQTLFDEGLFLSTRWTQESETGEFVKDILTHIGAVVYLNPGTGRFEIKLIRDDYDALTVPVWDEDKVRSEKYSRKSRGEIVNRLTLTYTNPESGKDESIVATDEASVAMQAGEIVNSTVTRPMVRNADIAARLVEKEMRVACAPLASGSLKVLRDANGDGSTILPGQVFRFSFPRLLGEETILCRITEVNYGKTSDRYVGVTWVEDIYSLPIIRSRTGSASFWEDTSIDPVDMQFRSAFTVPFPFLTLVAETGVADSDFPDSYVGLLGWFGNTDVSGFTIAAPQIDSLGNTTVVSQAQVATLTPSTTLLDALAPSASASIRISTGLGGVSVKGGDFVVVTPTHEDAKSEWMLVSSEPVTSVDGEISFAVQRGMFDTTPKAWPAGTRVWIVSEDFGAFDQQLRSPVPLDYYFLTRTSRGQLSVGAATEFPFTPTERPYLPFRPANVVVGGLAFGRLVYATSPASVMVTWANRDRLSEDSSPLAWDAGDVPGEMGQTTEIDVVDLAGTVVFSATGLTGTSYDIDFADFGPGATHYVQVWAARDGLRSLQAHQIEIFVEDRSGYGTEYGAAYGES